MQDCNFRAVDPAILAPGSDPTVILACEQTICGHHVLTNWKQPNLPGDLSSSG